MEVWYVHPKSHVAELGLKVGDIVTKLDGKIAAKHFHTAEWNEHVRSSATVTISIQGKADEKPRELTVNVLELLKS